MTAAPVDVLAAIAAIAANNPNHQPAPVRVACNPEDAGMARAEDRAAIRRDFPTEHPDRHGRDADWNWPRGYGGTE